MSLARISGKRLLTIPIKVFNELGLKIGDYVEFSAKNGEGRIVPQRVTARAGAPRLSAAEQKVLKSSREKIDAINNNHLKSQGLTKAEIKVAAKVGLIDPEQAYYWTEEWQNGEREATADIKAGRVSKKHDNIETALKDLKTAKV